MKISATAILRLTRSAGSIGYPSSGEPALQRRCALGRRFPSDDRLDADVLVEIGPVNSLAPGDQAQFLALRQGRMQQSRIPSDRCSDRTTVVEVHNKRVILDSRRDCRWYDHVSCQSSHSRLPSAETHFRTRSARHWRVPTSSPPRARGSRVRAAASASPRPGRS